MCLSTLKSGVARCESPVTAHELCESAGRTPHVDSKQGWGSLLLAYALAAVRLRHALRATFQQYFRWQFVLVATVEIA
jgi:hypothetical protein